MNNKLQKVHDSVLELVKIMEKWKIFKTKLSYTQFLEEVRDFFECGINIPVVVVPTKLPYTCDIMFDDATVRLSFKNKKFIYIKTTVKGSSIIYNRKTMSPF